MAGWEPILLVGVHHGIDSRPGGVSKHFKRPGGSFISNGHLNASQSLWEGLFEVFTGKKARGKVGFHIDIFQH